jgi:hypothetical protein
MMASSNTTCTIWNSQGPESISAGQHINLIMLPHGQAGFSKSPIRAVPIESDADIIPGRGRTMTAARSPLTRDITSTG